ncbi:hypothetical protein CGRA01v4_06859 [Colletotrichum graminicola]|uniref:ribonuclease H n=1 Tax=Colletotrichum graminicola (strain M1.001 / M2 / FGSC 10212) TaxID=645133 RepID=E3Q2R3_COLGM|nr:uncharacterized protein GLRG_00036 [Colletotrichum graminicola M1.001]EFQ24892.1 hypothetical protein GLRG_00036 [Colletotrichum graminicola M1.001]WDK15578.1 hypothetical protein CGRA01v4_06859 [Colletotrichum graminicola]
MPLSEIDYIDLPNGRTITVCAHHHLVTCGMCCLDFSDDNADVLHGQDFFYQTIVTNPRPETTMVFPSKFSQQGMTPLSPEELFPGINIALQSILSKRFINRYNDSEFLIYTDGACSDNGAADARGGCAFVFKPNGLNGQSGSYRHTSNRAELRAVIAALRFRAWHDEGFRSVVIATDSSYVVDGATSWTRNWARNDCRLSTGDLVKNRDLWEALLLDVEELRDCGVSVRFWKIPRQQNTLADREAKRAASAMESTEKFRNIKGNFV